MEKTKKEFIVSFLYIYKICYHILAVRYFLKGENIDYIPPPPVNLTNLAKYKHSGKITGLKNKGHVKNSILIPLVTQITKKQEYSSMHSNFLKKLVIDYANLDNN